jgi:hypothetical protein
VPNTGERLRNIKENFRTVFFVLKRRGIFVYYPMNLLYCGVTDLEAELDIRDDIL